MKHTKLKLIAAGTLLVAFAFAPMAYAQTSTSTTTTTTTTTSNNVIFVSTSALEGRPNIFVGRDLTVGSTGTDVAFLQGLLSELGFLNVPFGIPLGYYGPMTKSAVARYQASQGVINTGYFGPLTKIAMRTQFNSQGWLAWLFPAFF